jgi:hypothetical protein
MMWTGYAFLVLTVTFPLYAGSGIALQAVTKAVVKKDD